jgi:hypothetical protein
MGCFFEAEWGMLSSVEIMRRSCLFVSMTLENAGVTRDRTATQENTLGTFY